MQASEPFTETKSEMTEKEKALIQDYKHTFGSEHGKRVYADLMVECHMDSPVHNVGNVNETFIFGGMRAVGLHIKRRVEADLSKKVSKTEDTKQPIEM